MPVISNRVQCLVTGEQTLRFVNLCRNNGIELRHLIRKENAIQMEIENTCENTYSGSAGTGFFLLQT